MITLVEIEAALPTLKPAEIQRLEAVLRETRECNEKKHLQELYGRTGVQPFPQREGSPVTTEMVLQICEEEGI